LPFRKDGAIIYLMALFLLVGFFLLSGLFSSVSASIYQLPSVSDVFVLSDYATTNFSYNNYIQVGKYNQNNSIARSFLSFGLANFAHRDVNSVKLRLYLMGDDYASANGTLNVYRVYRNWVESQVTWNIYSTGNNWGTAGATGAEDSGELMGTVNLSDPPTAGYIDINLDVTIFQNMIDTVYKNYGFLLKNTGENGDTFQFRSNRYRAGLYAPLLVIDFDDASSSGGISVVEPDSDTKSAIENYDKVFGTALVLAMFSFGYLIFRDSFHA